MAETVEDPCATCTHSWHGLPCRLRTYGTDMARMYPLCPCNGPFLVAELVSETS